MVSRHRTEARRHQEMDVNHQYNRGNSFFGSGAHGKAAACYRKVLLADPGFIPACFNLSIALKVSDALGPAIKILEQLLCIDANAIEAHKNLAFYLHAAGRLDEAITRYSRVLGMAPTMMGVRNDRGIALKAVGRYDDAMSDFRRALIAVPDFAAAYNNSANIYEAFGRQAGAVSGYRRALFIQPGDAEIHRNLSKLVTYRKGDPAVECLEALKNDRDASDIRKMHFCFALGKAYADMNDPVRAFDAYSQGNRLRKQQLRYDIQGDRGLFRSIESFFSTEGALERKPLEGGVAGGDVRNVRPIFIVGMPRSGTSLIEQVLAGHSQVHGAGELSALTEAVAPVVGDIGTGQLNHLDRRTVEKIRERYRSEMERLEVEQPVIVDKMPGNFRWIGFIHQAFPEAKIVHLSRDPMAVCWSVFRHFFSDRGNGFAYDLEDLGQYFKLYAGLMRFWQGMFPGLIHDVDYERFTESPEWRTRELLAYCGLEWEEGCLDFRTNDRAVLTASSMQVRQDIYKGSSGAWRAYEEWLGPLKDILQE